MPASNEIVANRPLSGTELRDVMLKDLGRMLATDGMFSPHIAYKRAAYEITVKLHVDNPVYPHHNNKVTSKSPSRNETDPVLLALEPPPLTNPKPSESAVVAGAELSRVFDSPNQVRLENDLPLTVTRRDGNTGEMKDERVTYDNRSVEIPPPNVVEKDISEQVADEWEV